MEIHNLAEDEVSRLIHRICDEEEEAGEFGYCTSVECRVDAVCYVLNRTQPRYVSSARGMSHVVSEQEQNTQAHIDLVALAHEALSRISSVRRSYYDVETTPRTDTGPGQQEFPIITGRLLIATTFQPVANTTITLYRGSTIAPMVDHRWENPYEITPNTSGQYSFWPHAPEDVAEHDEVEFLLAVDDPRFEEFRKYFTVPV
ncbi:MAG: late competence development ComFB family protein, partial [Spirochaetota bacterium]